MDFETVVSRREGNTVLAALSQAVAERPTAIFLDFEGDRYTYEQVDRNANRLANHLAALGIAAGEPVSTILDNNVDAIVSWFAINKRGALWSPVNTAFRKSFLQQQLADAGTQIVICESAYLERVLEIADGLPALRHVLVRGGSSSSAGRLRIAAFEDYFQYDDAAPAFAPEPGDIAALLYTSGTTGPSKGCMISHNYLCNQARQSLESTPVRPGEVIWTSLPLFHIGALSMAVVPALLLGQSAAIASRFSVTQFWPDIERSGARVAILLASMLPLLADAPDSHAMLRCRGQIRAVWGVPLPPPVRRVWQERFGVEWMNGYGYGSTEGGKIFTYVPGEPLPPEGSVGRLADDFEAMIVDDNERPVPPGTPGEVLYRPRRPNVMFSGYWKRPEATVEAWRNLWMHSGDVGFVDENGYFTFVDRKKDCIRRRGENVSSFEIERVLAAHPAVAESAASAVKSPLGEDDLKVTVVLAEGTSIREEELCRWCIEQLPFFAVPRFYEFRVELPKTPTGRVQKFKLREDGVTSATWDMEQAGIKLKRS